MKRNFKLFVGLFTTIAITFYACTSTKTTHGETVPSAQTVRAVDVCNQTIRYYAEKIRTINGDQETNAPTEIVINPASKTINIISEPPNQSKLNFNTVIESVECNLSANITEGQAIYSGYIKQPDGTAKKAVVKVEVKDGGILISGGDTESAPKMTIAVTKWEVVKE